MLLTPQDFVSKWKRAEARERQSVQEHFLDLCALVGHPTPMQADPTGTRFAFEMGAAKTSGGSGWADVAKLGYFGWEYKGKDSDLDKAYEQLLRYRDALQNPPLLIVSDINKIIIRTNYTNLATRTITLTLDDLLTAEGLKTLKAVFFEPESLKPRETVESVTQEAARQFAMLANVLRKYGEEPQAVAHFLIRLLFCLFAEDIGLLPERLFPRLLEQTRRNSKDFAEVLRQLFRAMNTGGYFGADRILHFNGGLFYDDLVLPLDSSAMDIIGGIDGLDWGAIQPSIFGTLFERGLDPEKRSQLGAHYTGEADILLMVEPVLMAPLRREWAGIKDEIRKMKEEERGATGKRKKDLQKQIQERLLAFADQLALVKVLDPACGSGNFLYVALRLLLDLQNEVLNFSDEMGAGRPYVTVTPAQLYGIEANEYAYELAQMTIQIGYIQWLRENGYGFPVEPILRQTKNILNMDAILTPSHPLPSSPKFADGESARQSGSANLGEVPKAEGVGAEPQWPAVDVILGNPPFLGNRKMRPELGNEYCDTLLRVYGDRIEGMPDLVCYWFEKAINQIQNNKAKRVGLLATQAIRGGTNRQVLEHIKEKGNIFFAYSDKEWVLDGATVHVSMIGFDNGDEKIKELDGKIVDAINPDLTGDVNITEGKILKENEGLSFQGVVLRGQFNISRNEAEKMLGQTNNPNGLPNSDVIRRRRTGEDIVNVSSDSFVIDFGVNMPIQEAAQFAMPFEYLRKNVYPLRQRANQAIAREKWWIHWNPRSQMRMALANIKRYIATPRVAKHRIFVWLESDILPDAQLVVFARDDDYFLGILQSKLHELWARRLGTQLRDAVSGFRYTSTTTFETFPFPWAPGREPQADPRVEAIAQAARELVEQRERWLAPTPSALAGTSPKSAGKESSSQTGNADLGEAGRGSKRTLTALYNQRPIWLALAHEKLDRAVFAAYGWPSDLSDEDILARLLSLNLERSEK